MKSLSLGIFILISICFSATGTKALNRHGLKYDSLSCLRIEGIITNAGDGIDGECIVELIGPNETTDSLVMKEGKRKFRFVLNKNSYYAIRISKKGYLSKVVAVNTEMLGQANGIHVFEFETSLIKDAAIKRLNPDILDLPVAIVHFDYEMDCFSYNKEYSAYIKRELHKVKTSQRDFKPGTPASLTNATAPATLNRD